MCCHDSHNNKVPILSNFFKPLLFLSRDRVFFLPPIKGKKNTLVDGCGALTCLPAVPLTRDERRGACRGPDGDIRRGEGLLHPRGESKSPLRG